MILVTVLQKISMAWVLLLGLCGLLQTADAKPTVYRYLLSIGQIKLLPTAPVDITDALRVGMHNAIAKHDRFLTTLPPDAPDRIKQPAAYAAYLKKNRIRAYVVRIEIMAYMEQTKNTPTGQQVVVALKLRLFGEKVPENTMGFTGTGQAQVTISAGRRARERHYQSGRKDAIAAAVDTALATSLRKLDTAKPRKKRRKN